MVSTFTPNIQLEEPARADQNNAWFTPINAIMTTLDLGWGGIATIATSGSPITLSTAQFKAKTLSFSSTLIANITVTFPTSFIKSYEVQHLCTGSSAFTITLATTASGGQVIGVPPGETISVLNNGSDMTYLALHHVGDYWDHAGSVPAWVSGCTVPPYLNCDGTTFSSATYPQLAALLGTVTLPDSRGRGRWALNQTTGRLNSSVSGVDGTTNFAAGGNEAMQRHNHPITDSGHSHGHNFNLNSNQAQSNATPTGTGVLSAGATINSAVTGISVNNAGTGASQNMPPAYIGGVTMIRAA